MPTYTFTVDAEQDAAITARRLKEAPNTKDNAAFVTASVSSTVLAAVVQEFIEARVQKVADAYRAGTADQRAAVDTALGLRG